MSLLRRTGARPCFVALVIDGNVLGRCNVPVSYAGPIARLFGRRDRHHRGPHRTHVSWLGHTIWWQR